MKTYTAEEVAAHNKDGDCWLIIENKIYDVSTFIDEHPGGKKPILAQAGRDATKTFHLLHRPEILKEYGPALLVGELASTSQQECAPSTTSTASSVPSIADLKPSDTQSWNSGGTAHELPEERKKASFNIELLTNVLDGGPENTKRRRFILKPLLNIDAKDKYNMDRSELVEKHFKEFIGIHKPFIENGYIPQRDEVSWMSENSVNSGSLMPHMSLFLTTIMGQASPEQVGWWLYRAITFQMVGSYAQTELGHGSNVRGLRTVAEYDKATQEFVLNTPTLQSMKWWNSNIGIAATHAVVFAQLVIDKKEYGVHVFMVQLRDENHQPLPGIEMGDVGPKLGDHAIDTGYLRLQNVRIPRKHMFAKRQEVTPEGRYIKHTKGSDKMHYLTMMSARAGMVSIAGGKLAIAATIATRYSCVRRQGFVDRSQNISYTSEENKIIDYQMQQYRLFKQIAIAYAIKFTGRWMTTRFDEANAESEDAADELLEVHASSSGLKGLCSKLASDGIEDCRKCCGGHGYLLNSGVASIAADYVWQTTAEGDFIVLLLQTARFLIKCFGLARRGKKLPGLTAYLAPLSNHNFDPSQCDGAPTPARTSSDYRNVEYLLSLFRYRALASVFNTSNLLQRQLDLGVPTNDAWNKTSITLVAMAKTHCYYFMLQKFAHVLNNVKDNATAAVLRRLFALFACTEIIEGLQWNGLIDGKQTQLVNSAVSDLLGELRPDAVSLVDAFDFPDNVLNSTIGRYDGNVYEALYEAATRSRLNRVQPFKGYEQYLRPHLDLEMLKLHNKVLPEAKM